MYTLSSKISQVIHYYEPHEEGLILIRGTHEKSFLEFLNEKGDELAKVEQDTAYDFLSIGNNILFTNKQAVRTYSYNRVNKNLNMMPYVLHLKGHRNNDEYFCYAEVNGKECFVVISLDSLIIINELSIDINLGMIDSFLGDRIVSSKKRNGIVGLIEFPNNIIWQLNIPQVLKMDIESKISISSVYVDKTTSRIYVIYNHNVICVSLNGEILWITDIKFRSNQMHVKNNEGYIVAFDNFIKMDLDTGRIKISKKIENILFASKEFIFQGHSPQIFNGSLWCPVQTNGYNFVTALNPDSGVLEWWQNVATPHFINTPTFYKSKMYILDTGGNLFIYSKD